jgi:DNA-binding MarR family transcriptional regulator
MQLSAAPADPTPQTAASVSRSAEMLQAVARYGAALSEALAERVGDPDLVGNITILLLFDLYDGSPRRPTEIGRATGLSSGGVTKFLDRLEAAGLLARTAGHPEGDRRGVSVVITPAGRHFAETAASAIEDQVPLLLEFAATIRRLAED